MKIITDEYNNIICKVFKNRTNEEIRREIKKSIWNMNIIKRSAKRPKNWIKNDIFIKGIDEIDINNGFSVELWYDEQEGNNTIQIYGDNGLIELEIINLNTIKELIDY